MKPVVLLYNPTAGARVSLPDVNDLCAVFAEEGWSVIPRPTTGPRTAASIIEALKPEIEGVVVVGGDGTINECLPALVGTRHFLAILPGGTANVLAHEIGVPARLDQGARALARGEIRPVTVGRVGDRYFLGFMGIGFDAQVASTVSLDLKKKVGKAAYVWELSRQLRKYSFPPAVFEIEGETLTAPFGVIGNASRYGGGLKMTPLASLESSTLDVCLFHKCGLTAYLGYLWGIYRNKHRQARAVSYRRVKRIVISGDDAIPYQIDGEPAGRLPLEVESMPGALRLVFPAQH